MTIPPQRGTILVNGLTVRRVHSTREEEHIASRFSIQFFKTFSGGGVMLTNAAYALLVVYATSTLFAAVHVYRALRCCNGLGECGRCTPIRWTCAMLRSFAVPLAMVVTLTTLWPLTTGSTGDRARRLLDGLPRLWDVVTALAVWHTCCDASTGARVAFVEYADRYVHTPQMTRRVLGDDQ